MKKNQRLRTKAGYEVCLCPFEYLRITQGDCEGTHPKYAIDNAGKDSGVDTGYMPFTGRIVYKASKETEGNAVVIESVNKVMTPKGLQNVTVMFIHDNDISNLMKGQILPQGTAFIQEGTAGKAKGNHFHVEVSLQKFTKPYNEIIWHGSKAYYLPGSVAFEDAFFMNDTQIIQGKADWKCYIEEGWLKDDTYNVWYYYEDGKMITGWKYLKKSTKNEEGWYYFNPANGVLQQSRYIDDQKGKCWVDHNGKWNGIYK